MVLPIYGFDDFNENVSVRVDQADQAHVLIDFLKVYPVIDRKSCFRRWNLNNIRTEENFVFDLVPCLPFAHQVVKGKRVGSFFKVEN